MKKITAYVLFAMLIAANGAWAETPGMRFLNIGVGAHAQSMGNAYSAQAADASAMYWNPSALARLESEEIFLYHTQFISDFQYDYFAYAHPLRNSGVSFGLALGRFSKGGLDGRDEEGRPSGSFEAADNLAAFSLAKAVNRVFSFGATVKAIQSNIGSFSSNGFALDLSASRRISSRTNLAAGIYHLGPSMKFESESFRLPANLSLGASHQLSSFLTLNADLKYGIPDQKPALSAGGEFTVAKIASFRLGYLSGPSQGKSFSGSNSKLDSLSGMGMGLGIRAFSRASMDYAFIPMGEMGGTHHMNLNWRFK